MLCELFFSAILMKLLFKKYQIHFADKKLVWSSVMALLFLCGSLVVNYYAGQYANQNATNFVGDVILSNIPVFDVHSIFIDLSFVLFVAIVLVCLWEPKTMPFTVKSIALFILIRSVFINLTHIKEFPTHTVIDSGLLEMVSFTSDLFFSGHVGIPFLIMLTYWKNLRIRYFFLAMALILAVVVLLGHLHYSIDVFSAFFITYTIADVSKVLFKKDFQTFQKEEHSI